MKNNTQCIVMGASAGGVHLIHEMLMQLTEPLPMPILCVQHIQSTGGHYLQDVFTDESIVPVHEAEDQMPVRSGHLYIAPANYHMLLESTATLSLSIDESVHHCRPSIDVLFESAVEVFNNTIFGVILTGMGDDGAEGLRCIHQAEGECMVQTPSTAEYSAMPTAALNAVPSAHCMDAMKMFEFIRTHYAH